MSPITQKRTIPCPNCSKKFKKEADLEQHQRAVHKIFKVEDITEKKLKKRVKLKLMDMEKVFDNSIERLNKANKSPKRKDITALIDKSMEKYRNGASDEMVSPAKRVQKKKKFFKKNEVSIGEHDLDQNLFKSDSKKWKFRRRPKRPRDRGSRKIERQHIKWWIGRPPLLNEYVLVRKFMKENNVVFIKEIHNCLHYRQFYSDGKSLHFIIYKKYWGFNFNVHMDIQKHIEYAYTKESLQTLSKLYLFLKDKYGRVFMLPRQEKAYQGLLGELFSNKWGDVKRLKTRDKLRN